MKNETRNTPAFNHHWPVILAALLVAVSAPGAGTNLTWKAEALVKETYDDNVYIENITPNPANVLAAEKAGLTPVTARHSSFVNTVQPRLSLGYDPCAAFNVTASYAPEMVVYDSAESEDYIAHRAALNFRGQIEDATWEWLNSETFVEGNAQGPVFARSEDVPAIGGIPLRDRREQFVDRNNFHVTMPMGDWFIRPVAAGYYHDFLTHQQLNTASSQYYYENYIDREDVNGGVDVGYDVGRKTYLVLGYRYGRQYQFYGPSAFNSMVFGESPYDSSYHRALFGIEGCPFPWLKLATLGGPEFRKWDSPTPTGFDREHAVYWVDATATLLPDKNDTMTLLFRRFEQPAFSSQSMYDDITYSATWRHTFNEHLSATAGFQLYIGDWLQPVNRDDWIYTPSASLSYVWNRHWSAELSGSYDIANNKTSTGAEGAGYAEGREFTRHLVSLAVKYAF